MRVSNFFMPIAALACAAVLAAPPASAAGKSYTYTYIGPNFSGQSAHLVITLTVPALLTPSTQYTGLPPGSTNATITVVGASGAGAFSLPVNTFLVNTDAGGNVAAWDILSDSNVAAGPAPLVSTDHQAYSINTLSTAVPLPAGVLTHINYDQATVVSFYSTCTGVPGCTLAGNGQPYAYQYSGIVNPAAGKWKVTRNGGTGGGGGGTHETGDK